MGCSLEAEGAGEFEGPGPEAGPPSDIAGCNKIAQSSSTTQFQPGTWTHLA